MMGVSEGSSWIDRAAEKSPVTKPVNAWGEHVSIGTISHAGEPRDKTPAPKSAQNVCAAFVL